ncbi:MAG TPA: transporter substrate-binding domain-containing protein [Rhodocyclaceae bacterium]|nr:transporter substrate-binding domain-containing protein [Rhodocyclaceae bacterium]HMV54616.1 transporter substrate-binding domain-containing protein [Rhodocyclaceae bacterium]HMZ84500.1 transporter substrate-binding domain-containing protein [Rhodocyclaceae bacterium]HNA04385.1 transporter substrate-binding domain-containing protein [Rhodocyclaceae bacterium]HNB77861.1 transporter substrate-binding domain-containing protein [Rhodocyclaceae bacterium]
MHLWISSALHRAAIVVLLLALAPLGARANDLADVVKSGQISVALYKEFAPFSDEGKGVDVDIAKALAGKLGVKLAELWFDADENMEDDLRNMVWRGTLFGYGPADFMIHVPVDKEYMSRNDKVIFFAPYYRERFAIARNVEKIANLDSLAPFRTEKIGVESATYPDTVLLSIESGAYRNNVVHFKNTDEAIEALKKGEVAAVMAMQGELEGGLFNSKGFEISEPPIPVIGRRQWPLGLAVKAGNEELARALQKGINDLVADGTIQKIFDRYGVKYRAP